MSIKVNYIENDTENKDSWKEYVFELIVMSCALSLAEISEEMNAVLSVLTENQSLSKTSFMDLMADILCPEDKETLLSLCELQSSNFACFAEVLKKDSKKSCKDITTPIINHLRADFREKNDTIVLRYLKEMHKILKDSRNSES